MRIAVVGAGFSGAVAARELALAGYQVTVFDSRKHIGGNCHTEFDEETGILVHRYGPHIFHTGNEEVWRYIREFGELEPFTNRVKSLSSGRVYSFPVNLHTINQFFDAAFTPAEAAAFIASRATETGITSPQNFEQQALSMIGAELYEAFFKGYTEKQWGCSATALPASILKRLPLRFTYDDNYYTSRYQGIPLNGYTAIIKNILQIPGVKIALGATVRRADLGAFDHVFWSGTLDGWYDYELGSLRYRTLHFEEERSGGDFQGNPVINYPDAGVPFTRIAEHKHFSASSRDKKQTIIFREYSRPCGFGDEPFYPLRLVDDKEILERYTNRASSERFVTFLGRLGTYRYIDMHVAIAEALDVSRRFISAIKNNERSPVFSVSPTA